MQAAVASRAHEWKQHWAGDQRAQLHDRRRPHGERRLLTLKVSTL
jgi:hypothetical protein